MTNFTHEDLTIEVAPADGAVLRLDWRGRSNAREATKVLRPFFDAILGQARDGTSAVEMHFERIDHFNSSTITALIQLIQRTREARLPLVLVFAGALKWQKVSFDALRIFEDPEGLFTVREAA